MKRLHCLVALLLVAALAVPAMAQSGPKKEKRVITEDDLAASRPPSTEPASSTTPAEVKEGEKKEGEGEPEDTRTEAQKAADEVKKWDAEEKLLQKKLATIEQKLQSETSEFRRQMYTEAIQNQQITLQEHRAKKAAAEQRLAEAKEKEGDNPQPEQKPEEKPENPE